MRLQQILIGRARTAYRRYADNIDKHGAGLTEYLAAAVRAHASRASA